MTVGRQRGVGARPLIGQVPDGIRHCLLFLLFVVVTLMAACRETSSTSDATPQNASAWRKIEPGGETTCAHRTPYAFWVRSGTGNKLLVYFQGGGGCWSAQTCRPGSPSYDATVTYRDSPEIREAVAKHYPAYTFSQFNTANDHSQERYFQLFGGAVGGFRSALQTSLHSIHSQAPNFRFYTAPGGEHCVLPYRRFYSVETGGVRLRDWVARLADHQEVPNVQCTKCDAPHVQRFSTARPQG